MSGAPQSADGLPRALVVGPQKTGTTWLYTYFEGHPGVCLPRGMKETFFFDRRFERGVGWYAGLFKGAADRLPLELAPSYFHQVEVVERVVQTLGQPAILVVLREPVQRSFSLYLHYRRYARTTAPLRQAVQEFPEILTSSHYATHLSRWFEAFGRERVLVSFTEDLGDDADRFVAAVCRHFGLDAVDVPAELRERRVYRAAVPASATLAAGAKRIADALRDAGAYGVVNLGKRLGLKRVFFGKPGGSNVPQLQADDAAWMREQLAGEVAELERMLGIDLSRWKEPA